jgi:hypothetical protein
MRAVATRLAGRPHRFVTGFGAFRYAAGFIQRIFRAQTNWTSVPDLSAALAHTGAVLHWRATSNARDEEEIRILIIHAGIVARGALEDIPKAKFLTQISQLRHWNIEPHLLQEEEMRCEDTLDNFAAEMRTEQFLDHSATRKY